MSDYKNTLNLPETGFPMKANLTQREPQRLKQWDDMGLYQQSWRAAERIGPPGTDRGSAWFSESLARGFWDGGSWASHAGFRASGVSGCV